jgi:hypothetical protein
MQLFWRHYEHIKWIPENETHSFWLLACRHGVVGCGGGQIETAVVLELDGDAFSIKLLAAI